MTNTRRLGYSGLQIFLHWSIAACVLFQLIFGESMTELVDAHEEGEAVGANDQLMGSLHYWVGIAILVLVGLRIILRLSRGAPEPSGASGPQVLLAKLAHLAFYVLLVLAPVLGLAAYYLGDPWGDIHTLVKPAFIVLIALHVAGALFHQFWLRDGTLTRMTRAG
ncbi:Cytochrome b-562 [Hartmannibacter diazotrophicus]|uniref:Cytochrome b-562 n=1 Tax=Hartmannibacter diazotrophicus TaxID=1482074 RepID=A0A2C9D562_9HYPH|nr:cytochrome b/b6 domain-containing protein [Hartmannibacter diazotrophicus]SON55467.1 Cytochrome b-562 [Hartmannibacter diazotrophicus]